MRPVLACIALLLAACAGPKPCTRTLCVSKLDGTMDMAGWNGTIRATADTPKPPVPPETMVTMVSGSAEFVNGKTKIVAEEGANFLFSASSRAVPVLFVTSGTVVVSVSTSAGVAAPLNEPVLLLK